MGNVKMQLILLNLYISYCLCDFSKLYSPARTNSISSQNLNILRKPGDCSHHRDYPLTIQCALTKECISFSQFQDGTPDCCGPKQPNCSDRSDEDRAAPSTGCKHIDNYDKGAAFQCTKTKVCLSRYHDTLNGRCDCCPIEAPDGDCSKCDDHSDEECYFAEWEDKFYCDGNCMHISLWANGVQDCPSSCIEPDVKDTCLNKARSVTQQFDKWWCQTIVQKNTPHRNCTGDSKCLTLEHFRDGNSDCANGEDEDETKYKTCTANEAEANCEPGYTRCVKFDQNTYHCRCGTGINCNKN